jgi:hypothetical protein
VVVGLDRWRDHFGDYADRYALIGGVACGQLMADAGLQFRTTKDLDIVLVIELLDVAFAEAFWRFIEASGYEVRSKGDGGKLYRFAKPKAEDYPYMIELFSRAPEGFELAPDSELTPLPIDETVASLSAILLDAPYYDVLKANLRALDGLPLLSEAGLIPFKAKAYLDLTERREKGEPIDSKDVRKHRNDVFRLLQLLGGGEAIALPDSIRTDMLEFVAAMLADEALEPKAFGVRMSAGEAIERLVTAYGL